jgi:hypothetical protein
MQNKYVKVKNFFIKLNLPLLNPNDFYDKPAPHKNFQD